MNNLETLPLNGGGGIETKNIVSNPYEEILDTDRTVSGSLEQDLVTFTFTTEDPQRGYFLDENNNQVNELAISVIRQNDGFAYLTTIPEPVSIGRYRFDHWSDPRGGEFTTEELSNTGYTANTVFTAHFRYVSGGGGSTYYTLTYNSNGGGTQYDSERYAENTVVTLDKHPTREGYEFVG